MRRKKNKIKNNQAKVIIISSVILLCLSVLLVKNVFNTNSSFHIESRKRALSSYKGFGDGYKTAGWIKVPGTNLDYPIIFSKNDLLDFPSDKEKYGWVSFDNSDRTDMVFINGHNIFNLSSNPLKNSDMFNRFEELMSFVYYDFAKDHQYFQYTKDGVDYIYKIFAVEFIDNIDLNYFYSDGGFTKKLKEEYIEHLISNSFYFYDVDVSSDDDIVSLLTCSRFYEAEEGTDFMVVGRLVRKEEKISNSKIVSNNVVYDEIKKFMKGDDENE